MGYWGTGGCRRRWQHFVGMGLTFVQMGLVSKEVPIKDGRGAGGVMLWAAAEYVVGFAAEHAPLETRRVGALEVGDRIDRATASFRDGRWWLVTSHGLFRRRHKRFCHG